MTYKQAIYAILISAALVVVGCQREASAPAPAQADTSGEDKLKIQLNLGKQGSLDYEKKDKASD